MTILPTTPEQDRSWAKAFIETGRNDGTRTARFHLSVLLNPMLLSGVPSGERGALCVSLGVPSSYATEAAKMLALHTFIWDNKVDVGTINCSRTHPLPEDHTANANERAKTITRAPIVRGLVRTLEGIIRLCERPLWGPTANHPNIAPAPIDVVRRFYLSIGDQARSAIAKVERTAEASKFQPNLDDLSRHIAEGKVDKTMSARFHLAVLQHPDFFRTMSIEERKVVALRMGATRSYYSEINKMLALSSLIVNTGISLNELDPSIVY